MSDLHTSYLGLQLASPIIVTSGPLTASIDNLKKCEAAGAGAVVLKSIFEEQIEKQADEAVANESEYLTHTDAEAFVRGHVGEQAVGAYLNLISEAKKQLHIPVIASINARQAGAWIEYAKRFENAGADALEINHYQIGSDSRYDGKVLEKNFIELVTKTKAAVSIPLSVKMGMYYTSLSALLHRFEDLGVQGVTLFNRFYQNDIDIDKIAMKQASPVSEGNDYLPQLRWTALMAGELKMDIMASTGVMDGTTLIKDLLAGAKAVGVCSAVIKSGFPVIGKMEKELSDWMDAKGFGTIESFRGKLAQERMADPSLWERSQYMKALQA